MIYQPKRKSLKKHEVPEWFHDAKLGIFIHWGLYSVPAFALTGIDIKETVRTQGFGGQFKNQPYAEWYLNTLRISGSPTQEYQKETYGEESTYDDFVPIFNDAIKKWNPEEMADIIEKSGGKYVVLVTKHHDGFLLWPSKFPNPRKENYMAGRDIVGEITTTMRKRGIKMGLYYSGTLDWSFNPNSITNVVSFVQNGVLSSDYVEYANNHLHELIDKYEPIVLWNDIGYPPKTDINEIFAYFYNRCPDGVINDRWLQIPKWLRKLLSLYVPRKVLSWAAKKSFLKGKATMPMIHHHDYKTPEYGVFKKISKKKWELTRGIGNSYGYNQFEKEEDHLTLDELIYMFVDLVSKNGNLLLNIGPKADGSIPEIQKNRLLALGKWLKVNGEAIYGTRPWQRAEGITLEGIAVRFTQNTENLFTILLGKPKNNKITIKKLEISKNADIYLLGNEKKLEWKQVGNDLSITIPENLDDSPAYSLKISPKLEN